MYPNYIYRPTVKQNEHGETEQIMIYEIAYCTHKHTQKHTWAFVYGACTFDRKRTLKEKDNNVRVTRAKKLRFLLQTFFSRVLVGF